MSLRDDINAEQRIADLEATLVRVQRQVKAAQARSEDLVQAVYQGARDASTIPGTAKPVKPPKPRASRGSPEVALLPIAGYLPLALRRDHLGHHRGRAVERRGRPEDQLFHAALRRDPGRRLFDAQRQAGRARILRPTGAA